MYQLVDSLELDLYWVFIPYTSLNFNPLDYQGVIETNIVVVSNTAGTLTIQIKESCNSNNDVTSLVPAVTGSFNLTGGTITAVALVSGNLEIDYTGTATAVKLNIVEDVNGNFYKSNNIALS
jgi:hypothetical protein